MCFKSDYCPACKVKGEFSKEWEIYECTNEKCRVTTYLIPVMSGLDYDN